MRQKNGKDAIGKEYGIDAFELDLCMFMKILNPNDIGTHISINEKRKRAFNQLYYLIA